MIIVDTPPVMLVTDAMLVCRHSDQAVMVVEYNRHSIEAIREGLNLFTKGVVNVFINRLLLISMFIVKWMDMAISMANINSPSIGLGKGLRNERKN